MTIQLRPKAILQTLIWIAIIAVAFVIYDLLILLFVAYILMVALYPIVHRFEAWHIPRWLGVLCIFAFGALFLIAIVIITVPPLITQSQSLLIVIPGLVDQIIQQLAESSFASQSQLYDALAEAVRLLSTQVSSISLNVFQIGFDIVRLFIDLLLVCVFSFYMILERDKVHRAILSILPVGDKERLARFIRIVDERLGSWVRGQLILMLVIGSVTLIGLIVVGMPYAIPLATIAGMLELIPIVGPLIAVIPAVLIAMSISPVMVVTILVMYILIQQLENNIIVPRIMNSAVGLDPLLVMITILIGARLAYVWGALLAVPVTAIILIIYKEWSYDPSRSYDPIHE